jgi:hypothetical protein
LNSAKGTPLIGVKKTGVAPEDSTQLQVRP